MIEVKDVLYLLDMLGKPIRALHDDDGTQVEAVGGSHSTLSTTVPYDGSILSEMQLIWRGERYIITDITNSRNNGLNTEIEAEIAYMQLSDVYREIDMDTATVQNIARAVISDTKWRMGPFPVGIGGRHSLAFSNLESSALKTLWLLERLSDGELKLQFDTLNYRVNFVRTQEMDVGFLFKYGKNVSGINKQIKAPQVTMLIPYGNDDMGIETVTVGNVNFVENYDYYIGLGYTLEEARQNFEKVAEFKDERYLVPGNLMREAERRLETLAFPQITYDTTIAYMDQPVRVGMTGYVQDDELGIKVKADVVRIIEYKDNDKTEVELNYLIPGVGDLQDINTGSTGGVRTAFTQLDREFNSAGDRYDALLQLSITNIASANLEGGFWFQSETSTPGALLDGYIDIDGVKTGHPIRQTLNGSDSHGYPFLIRSVPEGSHILRLMVKSEGGTFTVPNTLGELYVGSESLTGGMSTRAPVINYTEDVVLPNGMYVEDRISVSQSRIPTVISTQPSDLVMSVSDIKTLNMSVWPDDVTLSWSITDSEIVTVTELSDNELSIEALVLGDSSIVFTTSDNVTKTVNIRVTDSIVKVSPTMTSNTAPSPYVVSRSSRSSSTYDGFRAFNGVASSYWQASSSTGWLSIDMSTPIVVNMYRIRDANNVTKNPQTWTFEGSDNNSTWTVLDSKENVTNWTAGETKDFIAANDQAYRYYRLNITQNNGNSSYVAVGELQLYTT